jgi:hypothetical protein
MLMLVCVGADDVERKKDEPRSRRVDELKNSERSSKQTRAMRVECISTADLKQGRRYVERKQPDREQGWRVAFGMQSHRMLVARLIPCPSYDILLCLFHQSYCHTLSHAAKSVHLLVFRRNTQAVEARNIVGSREWGLH